MDADTTPSDDVKSRLDRHDQEIGRLQVEIMNFAYMLKLLCNGELPKAPEAADRSKL